MNRADKEMFVKEFRERVRTTAVFYLMDFSGLDVQSMTQLRQRIRESGGEFMVVKNRLVIRALQELDLEFPDLTEHLTGPTGVVMGSDGPVEPAKALSDFAKENQSRPVFKVGIVDQQLVDIAQFQQLAKLPPRDQLLAGLAGGFQEPLVSLVAALQGKLQEVLGLMEALGHGSESGEG